MNMATKNTELFLDSIHPSLKDSSFQKALFSYWTNLDNTITSVVKRESTPPIHTDECLREIDDIINAQDKIAAVACQSQASSFEGLLYKLALWRLDTPDFESLPNDADRKDCIVYSVFMDLINITGLENVKTKTDKTVNFLGN